MIMYEGLNMITCGMVNCYVIRGSRCDILIDTGRTEQRDIIEAWLENYRIGLIILTHGHNDHIENAGYFSELYGAPIMISPYDMRLARDNTSRPYYITTFPGQLLKRMNERVMSRRVSGFDPKIYTEEGMSLSDYGINGKIINLEGHTKGSVGVLCKSSVGYDLYAGDALMNIPAPMPPMICESPRRAAASVKRIAEIAPDRILVGHGAPLCKGGKAYKAFMKRIRRYPVF